jgi:hypothetical protein
MVAGNSASTVAVGSSEEVPSGGEVPEVESRAESVEGEEIPDRAEDAPRLMREEAIQVRGQRAKRSRPFSAEALAAYKRARLLSSEESIQRQQFHHQQYSREVRHLGLWSDSPVASVSEEEASDRGWSSELEDSSGRGSRHSDDQASDLVSEGERAESVSRPTFGRVTGGLRYRSPGGGESPFHWFYVGKRNIFGEPQPAGSPGDGRGVGWIGPVPEELGTSPRSVGFETTGWNRAGIVVVDLPSESDGEAE